MLTETERETFRRRLQTLMSRLDHDRSQLKGEALQGAGGEASGSLSNVPLHMADLGSHGFEEDLTLNLLENEEQMIEEVNAALARIAQGTYGHCEICRQEIAKERLQAVPYTRYCVKCAHRIQERGGPRAR